MNKKTKAWLQLIRLPNLFTVPGDPIAGYLLMGGTLHRNMLLAALSSLCLYTAGLISNDLADFNEDLKERPNRPLPSHIITKPAAWRACIILTLAGLTCAGLIGPATLVTALVLTGFIIWYNFSAKHNHSGPFMMGLCRGCSLLLGASALGPLTTLPLLAALMLALYIAAVTNIAARETTSTSLGLSRWLPLIALTAGWLTMAATITATNLAWPLAAAILSTGFAAYACRKLGPRTNLQRTPKAIGLFIMTLLLIQSTFCLTATPSNWPYALILILLIPAAKQTARIFYAS